MRKWLILMGVVGIVLAGYWALRQQRIEMPWDKPQTDKVTRGDIAVPITASGLIEPKNRFEIKSEASGEVIETPVRPGDFVHPGDVILVLKKDEEQRAVDRTKAEVDRAQALLAQSKINVRKARAAADSADATVERLTAEKRRADEDLKYERQRNADVGTSHQALMIMETNAASAAAQLRVAEANRASAQESIGDAEQAVHVQDAFLEAAQKTYEDALDRLDKTTLHSRHDAIVTKLEVGRSMIVQAATGSFMGGTSIMELADVSEKLVRVRIDEAEYGRIVAISPVEALPAMPELRESIARDEVDKEKAAIERTGKVRISVDAFRDENFEGRITRVEPQGRVNAGSSIIQFDVYVTITDKNAYKLPLGAQAQVEFTVDRAKDVLRVPNEAVKRLDEQPGVWVKAEASESSKERHPRKFIGCRFGITDGEFTEIRGVLDGKKLTEGMEVFTKLPKDEDDK